VAVENPPWLIGGPDKDTPGPEHTADVARLLAYVASAGSEGIVTPAALRVAAQATPTTSVRVLTGAGLILNRYTGAGEQTYTFRNPTQTTVPITATGSAGGRTDLIVARILDPQYEGQAPANPQTFEYARFAVIQGVPAGTKSARDLNLTYPAIALAKVTIPANTATITQAMITDLREVANPHKDFVLRAKPAVVATAETLGATSTVGEWFPNVGGAQSVTIPWWATRVLIEASWLQVREAGGNAFGECWVEWGPYDGPSARQYSTQRFDWNSKAGNDVARTTWEVADDRYIPAALRGTDQSFVMKARIDGSTASSARPMIDAKSGVKMRLTFLEVADPSTT
jgi:hypothetical protein